MLKNLMRLLLSKFYSKKESEAVGHQAMPSPSNTVITPSIKTECTTWSDAHIGIAPADGYLYVTGRTTNTDGFLQISSDTTEIAATTFGNTDKDIRLLFPLAKGQAMKVTAKSLKSIYLRFSSSIGGGGISALKNALLQGGGLCLKHLYSSLRRSSSSTRKAKSLLLLPQRLILTRNTQQGLTAPTNGATLSQLPLTAGLELKENALRLFTLMSALTRMLCDKASIDRAVLSRVFAEYRRVPKSITCSRLAGLFLRDVSFLFPVTAPQLNLAKGGVSC